MTLIINDGITEALLFLAPWLGGGLAYVLARAVCNAAVAGYATVAHWLDGRRRRDVPRPSVDGVVWR